MIEALEIISLMLLSTVKFLYTPIAVLALGYSPIQTILITFSGGFFGLIVFKYFGRSIISLWKSLYFVKRRKKPAKRVFTKRNRKLVHIRKRYGLPGLAFLMPVFSIPVMVFIAVGFYGNDRRLIPVFPNVLYLWSVILTLLSEPFLKFIAHLFGL
jgi:hypothetical protein